MAKQKKRGRTDRQHLITLAVILGVVTLILYGQVLVFDFINLDDPDYVYNNQYVRSGVTAENTVWAFTLHGPGQWHPLTWLSHQLDCELFELDAGMHHLVNALFHVANVVLLFLLLVRMTSALTPSFLVAALFAWHPLSVESVAWVSERRDVLSTCFCFLTLHAYVSYTRQGGWRAYGGVMFLFACGLMSKPMLVTLPCAMLLLDVWPLKRWQGSVPVHSDAGLPTRAIDVIRVYALIQAVFAALFLLLGVVWVLAWGFSGPFVERLQSLALVVFPSLYVWSWVRVWKSLPKVTARQVLFQVPFLLGYAFLVSTMIRQQLFHAGAIACYLVFVNAVLGMALCVFLFRAGSRWSGWRLVAEKIPLLGLSLVASLFTLLIQMQEQAVGTLEGYPLFTRLGNAMLSYATYLRKLVWPHDLAIFYPYPESLQMFWVGISALLLLVLSGLCIWQVRRRPYLLVGWLWYLGTLVPVIGLVQVGGQALADRYTYVPLIGIHIAVAWGLMEFVNWLQPGNLKRQVILQRVIAGIVLVPLLVVSFQQIGYWKSGLTLYPRALEVTEKNVLAHNSLAADYLEVYSRSFQRGETDVKSLEAALVHFERAKLLDPNLIQSYMGLASIAEERQDPATALRYLQQAQQRNKVEMARPIIARRLAWVLAAAPKEDVRDGRQALELAKSAVQLTGGRDAYCLHTLAVALAENQQFEEAINIARRALSMAERDDQKALVEQIQASLAGYQQKQPFRDPRW